MSFDDWILALHVLSAFALVAGIIFFWVLIVAVRQTDTPEQTLRMGPLSRVAEAAIGIGMGGTIALGVWLAFSRSAATTSGTAGSSRPSCSGSSPRSSDGEPAPPTWRA